MQALQTTQEINISKAKDIFNNIDTSETTCKDYKARIKLFIDYTKNTTIDFNTFLEYKRYLENRKDYSISTKNKYLASARIFLKELNKQGFLLQDITQNVKSFKQNKKHKKTGLCELEIQNIVNSIASKEKTTHNAKITAILACLIYQGMRQCEIIRLDFEDIDFASKTAKVQGKGCDDKEVIHLHPETVQAINEHTKINNISSGALFVCDSNRAKGKRITVRSIRRIISTLLNDLNIDKCVHGFRHFFTTNLIKNYKGDLLEVSKYTRHKSLEMLQVYNDNINIIEDLPRFYETFNFKLNTI